MACPRRSAARGRLASPVIRARAQSAVPAVLRAGGIFQIVATNLLIMSFGYRNFAVGTAYAKTEAAQSAVIALFILHEVLVRCAGPASASGYAA